MNEITTMALSHPEVTENPIFLALLVLIGLVIALVTIANLITNLSRTRAIGQQANAEGHLYTQLSEQAERHAKALDDAYKERNTKIDGELSAMRQTVKNLASKLDDKDDQIRLRDARNQELFDVILVKDKALSELKERVHGLELRLAMDESAWCRDCEKRKEGLTFRTYPQAAQTGVIPLDGPIHI